MVGALGMVFTVAIPVATFLVVAFVELQETSPVAPFVAPVEVLTYIVVEPIVPDAPTTIGELFVPTEVNDGEVETS